MGLLDPPGFRRNRHGKVWLHLGDADRGLMGDLLTQMSGLLAEPEVEEPVDPLAELVGIDPTAARPEDPALARLFPDAYEDPDDADEFRRFTQRDLRATKLANLTTAIESLDRPNPTQLSEGECLAWLGALNDLRLTLGTRLEVGQDSPEQFLALPEDDPRRAMYLVYDWLTYHQDHLVQALQKGVRS
jgi:Domain of unknown function (DUF2017)